MISTCKDFHRPEQLTTEVWNFIFFGGELPKDSGISEEGLLLDNFVIDVHFYYPPLQRYAKRVYILVSS